ncbi:carbon storage regulator [Luteimonas sp. SDU82]|uniref:carbon storage regulator n=1 Tax=Luteimonas sp. SDU82 TaxID=3422592 RepID=UPI003EBBDF13
MLILTRRNGEAVLIGDDIRLIISESSDDGKVRIGIEAPSDVLVLRAELLPRYQNQSDGAKANFLPTARSRKP